MKRIYTLAIAVIAVIGLALFATPASAVHKGAGALTCGSCHTMHNSQGGGGMGGTPTAKLLQGTAADFTFCLQCHADNGPMGSDLAITHQPHGQIAPAVLADGVWTQASGFELIGAGGDFFTACADTWTCGTENGGELVAGNALGRAHSLGAPATVVPPGGDAALGVTLQCTNCHDAHGTNVDNNATINRFRNLRVTPLGAVAINLALNRDLNADGGAAAGAEYTYGYIGGTTGTFAAGGNYTPVVANGDSVWPVSTAVPTNTTNSNQYTSVAAGTGISAFCATCHDNWHESVVPANATGQDWTRHPVDYVINNADVAVGGAATINWANYNGLGNNMKLPAAQSVGGFQGTNTYFANADNTDKVFCLSCHFAHGGPYYDNLRWQHATTVSLGDEVGAAIADTVGCQQCHLR